MRAVVQRVKNSKVEIEGVTVGEIGAGILILLGVEEDDEVKDAHYLSEKIAHLRIFCDQDGKMNLCVKDTGGSALIVSQFTLMGDCRKGRRPGYSTAARPEKAIPLYEEFVSKIKNEGIPVQEGVFQAMMQVHLINDGPVTLLLDSKRNF